MKTLKEYIRENFNYEDAGEMFISINNYFQDFITESIIQSYDVEKLINKLKKEFEIDDSDIIVSDYQSKSKNFKINYKTYKNISSDKLTYILGQYGYYFSNFKDGYANIEPIFSENVTDIVQDDCGGKIYKIISKKTADLIHKRKGLIIDKDELFDTLKEKYKKGLLNNLSKDAKKSVSEIINKQGKLPFRLNQTKLRNWTSRLFFFSAKNSKGLKEAIDMIDSQLMIPNDEWLIVEIDISNYNVTCWRDCYSETNNEDFVKTNNEDFVKTNNEDFVKTNNEDFVLLYINAFFPEKMMTIYNRDEFFRKNNI